jgi:AcrR family transcriptional regulator
MSGAWLREEQADLAVDKILEAASQAFVNVGVSRTRMGHIADYAGCSRGTLYRYFKTRDELHLAYINRSALKLSSELRSDLVEFSDPRARLVEGILRAVRAVRSTPGLAAWFDPNASGMTARMSSGAAAVDALAEAFVAGLLDAEQSDPPGELRARWLVRVIVSLLTMPGADDPEERALVERFVAPGLLAAPEA